MGAPSCGSPSPAMGAPATQVSHAGVLAVLAAISQVNELKKQFSALAGGAEDTWRWGVLCLPSGHVPPPIQGDQRLKGTWMVASAALGRKEWP